MSYDRFHSVSVLIDALVCGSALWVAFGTAQSAVAQQVSPVTVTPQDLRPETVDNRFKVEIPEVGTLQAPAGAESLFVALGDVRVDGAFPEVAPQVAQVMASIKGRRVSLAEVYSAASEIEAIHARAGYILARVSVPPQDLADGAPLTLRMTDGTIEAVDVSGLPLRIRAAVMRRTNGLIGRHHLTMRQIEAALMLTSDLPGILLRSTLMRGNMPGGTRLVLEGAQHLVTGSFGLDNALDRSLGRWETTLQLALNAAFGLGEQIYGFVSSGYQAQKIFGSDPRERVVGGGLVLPLGDGRFTINPEGTYAHTQPTPVAGSPPSLGTLRRLTMRANETLVRTRVEQATLGLTIEQIDAQNGIPALGILISEDRYLAARIAAHLALMTPHGDSYSGTIQFSQGLGDLAAITSADVVASKVPYSRRGSSNAFSKLSASLHASWVMAPSIAFTVEARGQTSFGHPVFRAEQIALEGADGLSAWVGGQTAVDAGAVERSELSATIKMGRSVQWIGSMTIYGFSGIGLGRLEDPTAVEQRTLSAFNIGAGLRTTLAGRITLGIEYAHGFGDQTALPSADHIGISTALHF